MKHVIISDLHLGNPLCRIRELEDFLHKPFWDRLILNGDIVDSLNFKKLTPRHWNVLRRLAELEPWVILGNHDQADAGSDVLLGRYFGNVKRSMTLHVASTRYHVEHGDQFDPLLHWSLTVSMADNVYQASQRVSKKLSRWLKKKSKAIGGVMSALVQQAGHVAQKLDCQGVILGHTHHADDCRLDSDLHYLNSGCWVGGDDPHYLLATEESVHLHTYKP